MLDPEGLARRWVPGEGEPAVRLLARGPAASTWQVRRDRRSYAMRVPVAVPPAGTAASADAAARETSVFAAAAAAGLGPRVAAADPASGILVTDWVRGRSWSRATARDPANAPRMAQLLQAIHALRPTVPPRVVSPAGWIAHYRALPGAGGGTAGARLAAAATQRLEALAGLPSVPATLCHSDLHRLNLVDSAAGLIVLDWEYAHGTDPYWDLAGWLSVNDLGEAYARRLLGAYCGYEPGAGDLRRLALLAWLYDYICLLWSEVSLERFAVPAAAATLKRARLLAARLQAPSP